MESFDYKVLRCATPVLIYFFVTLFVQMAVTTYITVSQFIKIKEDSLVDYMSSIRYTESVNQALEENGLVVNLIAASVAIIIGIRIMKRDSIPMGEKKIDKQSFFTVCAIGILASAGLSKLVTVVNIDGVLGNYAKINNAFEKNSLIIQIITLVMAGPVCEEIIFRGIMFNRIKEYTSKTVAIYIQAVVFAVYHFNLVQGIYAFLIGIMLAYVYEKYETFAASILLHIFVNLTALIMMYLGISDYINDNIWLKILMMVTEVGMLSFILVKKAGFNFKFTEIKKDDR